jgi:hypothetical protein
MYCKWCSEKSEQDHNGYCFECYKMLVVQNASQTSIACTEYENLCADIDRMHFQGVVGKETLGLIGFSSFYTN